MKKWLIYLVGLLLLAGCGQAAPAEPTPEETIPAASLQAGDTVIAEGVIEPARWSELRYQDGGTVIDVLVQEGDAVSQDDLLVRFDPTDAQLAVQDAQATLAQAEAQLAQLQAIPRPEEVVVAQARFEAAQAAVAQAAAQRDQLAAGATDADIAAAQAALAQAQSQQVQAEDAHDATMDCFNVRAPDGSKRKICPALGTFEELTRFQMLAANDALTAAQAQLEAARGGAPAQSRAAQAAVGSAAAQRDAAQARLDQVKAGPTAEQIAAAEAQVAQAQAALATAQAALDRTEVRAPFSGIAAQLNVDPGDTAPPGAVVAVVATLDQLQVHTTDLTELDVTRVARNQPATVTVDALPELELRGRVLRIDEQSVDYRGDVTYPVVVALDQATPGLRWGMTVLVEIETE